MTRLNDSEDSYTHEKYQIFTHENIARNGIHLITSNNKPLITYYLNKFESESEYALVFFNGAVSSREAKTGPFFSGLTIARELDLPILSISDPAVEFNREIGLGWYAGNIFFQDQQKYIAELLNKLSSIARKKLILIGGSGGGFAILSIIDMLCEQHYAIVWNPQTSIEKYQREIVIKYVSESFELKNNLNDSIDVLDKFGIRHDLINDTCVGKSKILFLQNKSDWHLNIHAIPYLESKGIKAELESSNCFIKNIYYIIENYGVGHIGPSRDTLKMYIKRVILQDFSFERKTNRISIANDDITVSIDADSLMARIDFTLSNYKPSHPKYCFYLSNENGTIYKGEYQKNNTLNLKDYVGSSNRIEISGFVLDCGFRAYKTKTIYGKLINE